MKDPWQPYLQLGVVHFMLYPECLAGDGPIFDTLAAICHDDFFDAVDVGPMIDAAVRRECAALLRDCQMLANFACQPVQLRLGLDINAADDVQRSVAVNQILELIPQARELGATRFVLMSGKNVSDDKQKGALDRLIESLKLICRRAREEAGLPVMLEIFDYDMDKKALVGPCKVAAQVARAVKMDYRDFGLLHDLSHIYLCHEDPAKHFPLIREHLAGMHIGSSVSDREHPMFGDTHPLFGMKGGDCGVAELQHFLRALFDIGYLRAGRRPVLGFEIRTPKGVMPQTAVANMKRTWGQAWWGL
jgi:sugar phosphate isomerase/epimerase